MKTTKIIAKFPPALAQMAAADKATLAESINQALEAGSEADDIATLFMNAHAPQDEADDAAEAICKAYQAEQKASARNQKIVAGVSTFQKWICGLAAVATGVLLYLALATPWVTKADLEPLATGKQLTDAVAPLATTEQVNTLSDNTDKAIAGFGKAMGKRFDATDQAIKDLGQETGKRFDATDQAIKDLGQETGKRFDATDQAIKDLAIKTDDLGGKADAIAASAARTEEIVTVGLTYKARCPKDSKVQACKDCAAKGEKRCYYRKPFQAASAGQVERLRKECAKPAAEAPATPPAVTPDSATPKVEEKKGEPKPQQQCPTGCQPVAGECKCKGGGGTVQLIVPDGYRLEGPSA